MLMMLFLTSGFMITNDIVSSAMTIGLWIVLAVFVVLGLNTIDRNSLCGFVILIVVLSVSTIINDENLRTLMIKIFSFFVAFCIVNTYSIEQFKHGYIRCMTILAVISLIGYTAYMSIPVLKTMCLVRNAAGNLYSNFIIYVQGVELGRNQGIFWEPGAFQTFLCLAILLEVLSEHINMKYVIILTIAVATTFSTTGYITLIFIFLLSYIVKGATTETKKAFSLLIVLALVCVFVFRDELFDTTKNSTFGKLIYYYNNQEASEEKSTSASVRINAIIRPIYAFLTSPLFGVGYNGLNDYTYEYTHNMNTCTFVNWFAVYGIGFGLVMLNGFLRLARKLTTGRTQLATVILILFLITASENFVNNPFFVMIALYGWMSYEREEEYASIGNQFLQLRQHG